MNGAQRGEDYGLQILKAIEEQQEALASPKAKPTPPTARPGTPSPPIAEAAENDSSRARAIEDHPAVIESAPVPVGPETLRPDDGSIKVLIFGLGDLYQIGGVQVSYEALLQHLISRGHRASLYSPGARQENAAYAYKFHETVTVGHYRLADSPEGRREIQEIATRENPDVILLVNSSQSALTQATALRDLPYPVVLSERGGDEHNLRYNWFSREQRAIAHYLADFTHFLMPSYSRGLPAWMQSQIVTIPELTEPSTEGFATPSRPDRSGRFQLMYAGRLSFEKDVDILIDSFLRIADKFRDWDLHVYGDGPAQEELRIMGALGGDRIVFHGALERGELFRTYAAAHVFALSSRAEGCPLALCEAMAHGLPVIGFENCSGVNEIIRDRANGLLASVADKPAGLAGALSELMSSATMRDELGRAGIEDVKKFAPAMVLSRWAQLLSEAAKYKGQREQLRKERYADVPEARRLEMQFAKLRLSGKYHNCFVFDPSIPLNRLEGVLLWEYVLLFGSVLFDPIWYGRQYPEVKSSGLNPLCHYLVEGYRSGYAPSAHFEQKQYVDVFMNGTLTEPPLVHYYRLGRYTGAVPAGSITQASGSRLAREREADGPLATLICRSPLSEDLRSKMAEQTAWIRVLDKWDDAEFFGAPAAPVSAP